jgi:serine/threonine protein kinase
MRIPISLFALQISFFYLYLIRDYSQFFYLSQRSGRLLFSTDTIFVQKEEFSLMQKSLFHHYYLTQLLDQQKFKSTYLAYPQGDMKLKVVVKIFDEECMLPNHDYAKSLTAIKGFLALDHPHIVPVLNMDIENRQPYIVTHHMSHGSLRQRLDSLSPKLMHWTTAVNIVIQIAQALMYAHERHIIHGNIKPNNIFFDGVGEVLLTDFRPSHFIDISKLSYKTDLQTTFYMAPEQFM